MKELDNNIIDTKMSDPGGFKPRSNKYKIKLGQAPDSGSNPTDSEGSPGAPKIAQSEMLAANQAVGAEDFPTPPHTHHHAPVTHLSCPRSPAKPGSQPQVTPSGGGGALNMIAATASTPLKQSTEKPAPITNTKNSAPINTSAPCGSPQVQGMGTQNSPRPLPPTTVEMMKSLPPKHMAEFATLFIQHLNRAYNEVDDAKNAAECARDEALAASAAISRQAKAALREEEAQTAALRADLARAEQKHKDEKARALKFYEEEAAARYNAQQASMQKLQALLAAAEEDIARAEAEKKKLKDAAGEARENEQQIWQETVKTLEERVGTLTTDADGLRSALARANAELQQANTNLAKRTEELKGAAVFLTAFKTRLQSHEQQLAEAKSTIEASAQAYANSLAATQTRILQKEQTIAALEVTVDGLQRGLQAAQKEKESRLQEEIALKRSAKESDDEVLRAKKREATYNKSMKEKTDEILELKKRVHALGEESKQAHAVAEKFKAKAKVAAEQATTERTAAADARRMLMDYEALIKDAELVISDKLEKEVESVDEINRQGDEIETLNARLGRAEEALRQKRSTISRQEKDIEKLKERLFRAEEALKQKRPRSEEPMPRDYYYHNDNRYKRHRSSRSRSPSPRRGGFGGAGASGSGHHTNGRHQN